MNEKTKILIRRGNYERKTRKKENQNGKILKEKITRKTIMNERTGKNMKNWNI